MKALPVPKRPVKQPTKAELLKQFKLDPRTEDEKEADGIRTVVSGIRDELMHYFKDNDFARIPNQEVGMVCIDDSGHYRYQRREAENAQQRRMVLHSFNALPIAVLRHAPEQLRLYRPTFERSAQLMQVLRDVTKFMDTYLKGVEVVIDSSRPMYDYDGNDRSRFIEIAKQGMVSDQPRPSDPREIRLRELFNSYINSGMGRTSASLYARRTLEMELGPAPADVYTPSLQFYSGAESPIEGWRL